jgi:hypothetical protein
MLRDPFYHFHNYNSTRRATGHLSAAKDMLTCATFSNTYCRQITVGKSKMFGATMTVRLLVISKSSPAWALVSILQRENRVTRTTFRQYDHSKQHTGMILHPIHILQTKLKLLFRSCCLSCTVVRSVVANILAVHSYYMDHILLDTRVDIIEVEGYSYEILKYHIGNRCIYTNLGLHRKYMHL